ncbi:MAG: acyltransferase [Clostridia bacterium]|nr:acyltransferase [Clostridia bacterium]
MRKAWLWLTKPYDANSKYIASADLMRVFCTLIVAWYHIWQQSWLNPAFTIGSFTINFNAFVRTGYMMVDMLLLLSGFLLFLPYARARVEKEKLPKLGEYYKKRVARIVPSYLFCIVIILFCFALPQKQYSTAEHMWTDILSHLTFTHNFSVLSYHSTRLNSVLWTLAVEVQFYLIAPLIGRAFVKKPMLTYLVMVAAAFAYRFIYVLQLNDYSLYLNRLPAMLDVYANGMMGALIYVNLCRYVRKSGWKSLIATAIAVLSVIGVYRITYAQMYIKGGLPGVQIGQMVYRFQLSLLGCLFLISAGFSFNWLVRLISCKPVRWLAMISFNVYIWHAYAALRLKEWRIPPYVNELPNQVSEQPWQLHYTLLCFAVALALGALVTYLIEKPAAKLILRPARKDK